jgi:hypothetical protein
LKTSFASFRSLMLHPPRLLYLHCPICNLHNHRISPREMGFPQFPAPYLCFPGNFHISTLHAFIPRCPADLLFNNEQRSLSSPKSFSPQCFAYSPISSTYSPAAFTLIHGSQLTSRPRQFKHCPSTPAKAGVSIKTTSPVNIRFLAFVELGNIRSRSFPKDIHSPQTIASWNPW